MEHNVQRLLNDKLYDKRKVGALEYVAIFSFYSTPTSSSAGFKQRQSSSALRLSPTPPDPDCILQLTIYLAAPLLGWNESSASLLPQKTTRGSRLYLTSSATSMPMPSINPMLAMEVSLVWPLPPSLWARYVTPSPAGRFPHESPRLTHGLVCLPSRRSCPGISRL